MQHGVKQPVEQPLLKQWMDAGMPAYQIPIFHPKTKAVKEKIEFKINNICLTVESPIAPYPTTLAQVKPYWNYVLSVFVTPSKLEELNDRIRAVAKVITIHILGKVVVEPDPDNVPGTNLKSMMDAVGSKNGIDFISIIELEAMKTLVQVLDKDFPGIIDKIIAEEKAEEKKYNNNGAAANSSDCNLQ